MRLSGTKVWALLLVCVFLGSAAAASVNVGSGTQQSAPAPTPTAGTTPRVVLLEMFTGTWCTWCGVIKPGISRLLDEFGPERLLMLAYHNGDTFADPAIETTRRVFYVNPFVGYPTTVIDGGGYTAGGGKIIIGSMGNSPADYDFYKGQTNTELTKLTNMQLTLSGDLTPFSASAHAVVFATDPVTETSLKIRFALYEDTLYATQTNGPPIHKYVVRSLAEVAFSITQGQTLTFDQTFTPQPTWDKNRMGVIAFVQADQQLSAPCPSPYQTSSCKSSPVIQAARLHYVMQNTLYVRDDDVTDMTTAPLRGEFMEAALSQANRPFDVYNTYNGAMDTGTVDIRGTPDLTRMEEYAAVIWSTGSATSFLSGNDAMNLGAYLDSFNGNLYMHGENVASDLATNNPAFLSNYLHASHGTDPVPAPTFMNGVAADPITGAWGATNLAFTGSSPDDVDPTASSTTILNYPGLISAGVRATHDADSRVVTMGQNYYQGSDTRKNQMVDNVLTWLDGAAAPHVTLIEPNNGESYAPGATALIKWSAIDVKIPVDAVDIYYTSDLAAPSWTALTTAEPNDGVYAWTVPNDDTANCGIRVIVRDGDMMTPDGIAITQIGCKIGAPNVSITKAVSNPTPQEGEAIFYTITLSNVGSIDANAIVTDTLPTPGVTYVSDDGALTGMSSYSAGTVTWTVVVPGKSSRVLHINVTVDVGLGAGSTVTNTASFQSSDSGGGSVQNGSDSVDFTIPSLIVYTLNLDVGTRFASIPLLLVDYRIGVVLASISGKYDYVRQYDPRDPVSPWKSYMPGKAYNSLEYLYPEKGFWINMNQAGSITAVGARPTTTNMQLYAGWNMVSYPSMQTTLTVGDVRASLGPGSRMEGLDLTAPSYYLMRLPDNFVLKAGEGYWIYVPADTTWVVTG